MARGLTHRTAPETDLLSGAGAWFQGQPPIRVYTEAGAEYGVSSDGMVAGGGRSLRGASKNKLIGAVEEPRGRIILEVVVPGLCMEIHRPGKSLLITTPVLGWEFESDIDPEHPPRWEARSLADRIPVLLMIRDRPPEFGTSGPDSVSKEG